MTNSTQIDRSRTLADNARKSLIHAAVSVSLIVSASMMASQTAYADVRDVNRTAGETVDTVLAPVAHPKRKKSPKSETKPLTCGVVFGILLCW